MDREGTIKDNEWSRTEARREARDRNKVQEFKDTRDKDNNQDVPEALSRPAETRRTDVGDFKAGDGSESLDIGDDSGNFQQARIKAGDEGDGTDKGKDKGESDKHKDKTEGAYQENKSYEEETAPIRRLLNKYGEGVTKFQTLLRMMDSRMYLTTQDPNRKKYLTEAPRKRIRPSRTASSRPRPRRRGRTWRSPVTAPGTSPAREKNTQGSHCKNIEARHYNKGARHTRQHQAETEDDKQGGTEHKAKAKSGARNKNIRAKNPKGRDTQEKMDLKTDLLPGRPQGELKEEDGQGEGDQKPRETKKAGKEHQGLHQMKRRLSDPTDSSGIPHQEVTKEVAGLEG